MQKGKTFAVGAALKWMGRHLELWGPGRPGWTFPQWKCTFCRCVPTHTIFHLFIFSFTRADTEFLSRPCASRSVPTWDSPPWPSHLSGRAWWTSPRATWITLWVFCCARLSARWTCLPAWRPSTCPCGRASPAPCSSSASWCTCSTGSTRLGFPWAPCPRPRCTTPCGSSTARSSSKVRERLDAWPLCCGRPPHCTYLAERLAGRQWKEQEPTGIRWPSSVFYYCWDSIGRSLRDVTRWVANICSEALKLEVSIFGSVEVPEMGNDWSAVVVAYEIFTFLWKNKHNWHSSLWSEYFCLWKKGSPVNKLNSKSFCNQLGCPNDRIQVFESTLASFLKWTLPSAAPSG